MTTSDIDTADRLSRRRARMFPVLAAIFATQQFSYFAEPDSAVRLVDHVKIGAWLLLSIMLVLALATGGFWLKPKRVRVLMDDDVTRANRADAFRSASSPPWRPRFCSTFCSCSSRSAAARRFTL